MTKRKWLFTTLLAGCISMGWAEEKTSVPLPTPAQITWQEAELTAVFHYDLHVFDGKQYNQAYNRITPIPDINIFNPTQYDTDQWIRSAKGMGAKIAILTATHETGVCTLSVGCQSVLHESLEMAGWERGYCTRLCQLLSEVWREAGYLYWYSLEFILGST